jgi:hypothetical protein
LPSGSRCSEAATSKSSRTSRCSGLPHRESVRRRAGPRDFTSNVSPSDSMSQAPSARDRRRAACSSPGRSAWPSACERPLVRLRRSKVMGEVRTSMRPAYRSNRRQAVALGENTSRCERDEEVRDVGQLDLRGVRHLDGDLAVAVGRDARVESSPQPPAEIRRGPRLASVARCSWALIDASSYGAGNRL